MSTVSADSEAQELEAAVRQLGIDGCEKELILALPAGSGHSVLAACRDVGLPASGQGLFVEKLCRQRWGTFAWSLEQRANPIGCVGGERATLPEQIDDIPAWYTSRYEVVIQKPLRALAFNPQVDVARAFRTGELKGVSQVKAEEIDDDQRKKGRANTDKDAKEGSLPRAPQTQSWPACGVVSSQAC